MSKPVAEINRISLSERLCVFVPEILLIYPSEGTV